MTERPFTFDDYDDLLAHTVPIDERQATAAMRERLRTATADEARELARKIIRGET